VIIHPGTKVAAGVTYTLSRVALLEAANAPLQATIVFC